MSDLVDFSPEDGSVVQEEAPSGVALDETRTTPGDGTAPKKNESPLQKFFPTNKVIARDRDGVLYQAVVRRAIYGSGRAEQLQLGLFSSDEVEKLQKEARDTPPCWHYFIHFDGWRTNFDSWVRDCDVYPVNENTQRYKEAVAKAHKTLRQEMTGKAQGKKGFQTIDGNKFLQEWRKRITAVDAEFNVYNPRFAGQPKCEDKAKGGKTAGKKTKSSAEDVAAMSKRKAMEEDLRLRQTGLTEMNASSASKFGLSFGLKRAMVEQWEIINQCGMVTHLPSSITIRHALNEYLKTKGIEPELVNRLSDDLSNQAVRLEKDKEGMAESHITNGNDPPKPENSSDQDKESKETPVDPIPSPQTTTSIEHKESDDLDPSSEEHTIQQDQPDSDVSALEDVVRISEQAQGWIDMTNGVAQFFDEALPGSLLYREEYPQFRLIQRSETLADKRYSEIYGCEHLLRLFSRLPDLLMEGLSPEDCRPLLAKLNDLTRFLHKNQSILMAAYHRKPNREEQAEAVRMENRLNARKKRQMMDAVSQPSRKEKKTKQNAGVNTNSVDSAQAETMNGSMGVPAA